MVTMQSISVIKCFLLFNLKIKVFTFCSKNYITETIIISFNYSPKPLQIQWDQTYATQVWYTQIIQSSVLLMHDIGFWYTLGVDIACY